MPNQNNNGIVVATCFAVYGILISAYGIVTSVRLIHQLITIKSKMRKSIQYLTILATIMANATICTEAFWIVSTYAQPDFYGPVFQTIIRILFRTLYFLCLLATLTIAVIRIHVTLHATSYQYPNIVYIIFWVIYIICIIKGILSTVGELFVRHPQYLLFFAVIGIVTYVFLTFYILTLFVLALKKITNNLDGKAQSDDRAQLSKAVIKYAILVITPSLVTLVTAITVVPYSFGYILRDNIWIDLIHFVIILLDLLINIICLALQFQFDEEKYFKIFGRCHEMIVKFSQEHNDDASVMNEVVTSQKKNIKQVDNEN